MYAPYAGSRASLAVDALLKRGQLTGPELAQIMGTESSRMLSYLAQPMLEGAIVRAGKRGRAMLYEAVPSQIAESCERKNRARKPPKQEPVSLKRAKLADTGDTPCIKFACTYRARCTAGRMACNAWTIYMATGQAHDPRRFALPTVETLAEAERDGVAQVGRHGPAFRMMFIDRPGLWGGDGMTRTIICHLDGRVQQVAADDPRLIERERQRVLMRHVQNMRSRADLRERRLYLAEVEHTEGRDAADALKAAFAADFEARRGVNGGGQHGR